MSFTNDYYSLFMFGFTHKLGSEVFDFFMNSIFPSNDRRLRFFVTAWIERNDYFFVVKIFFINLDPIQNIYICD